MLRICCLWLKELIQFFRLGPADSHFNNDYFLDSLLSSWFFGYSYCMGIPIASQFLF